MNNEGFGTNGVPFECTVEKKGKKQTIRKLIFVSIYVMWVILCLFAGFGLKLVVPLLCFIPLSVWILVYFTWKFTNEEIKITLFSGTMTVERLYDGKKPKKLAQTRIKDIEAVEPYSVEVMDKYKGCYVIYAIKNKNFDTSYVISFDNTVIVTEINDKMMRIIKYYG